MKVAVFVSLINYVRRFPFYLLEASLYFCLRINTSFNIILNKMKNYSTTIKWTARIMTMAFAALISIFAMDVFGEGYGFWQTILALFMHLIPTFFIILVLAFSWKWELVGGIIFPLLGLAYIILAWGKFALVAYLFISGPLFILGILYTIGWYLKKSSKA